MQAINQQTERKAGCYVKYFRFFSTALVTLSAVIAGVLVYLIIYIYEELRLKPSCLHGSIIQMFP